ncbi:MAG TPA: 50S ribosomal protein L6 [Oligoflexia bacterium]|nr:50S ribosomal protein L6 [Oligoflexia bacterium]HMP26484.1 50S ribosomal protein L6 [Oligoflexia bacterium]
MSRIGKLPITIPKGVKATLGEGGWINIEGPKGKLSFKPANGIKVMIEPSQISFALDQSIPFKAREKKQLLSDYGTARSKVNSILLGVTNGFSRSLEMTGVGYNAKLQGNKLIIDVGFSHDVELAIPEGIKCSADKTSIKVEGLNKELVGDFAAKIRKIAPPEPYLGKGIRYTDPAEKVRRKAGKTGKK